MSKKKATFFSEDKEVFMALGLKFARAWNIILHNQDTTPSQKLVLIEVCRYYPNPYRGSTKTISYNTAISLRQVQKILKALPTDPTLWVMSKANMILELKFSIAFDIVMHNQNTSPSEKLVLIEVCRYYPNTYYGSNATISHNTGLQVRQVQYILKALSTGPTKRAAQGKPRRRAYIDRGYQHLEGGGKPKSARVVGHQFLPETKPPRR